VKSRRNRLPGQIKREESQGLRREIAFYGKRVSMHVHRAKLWSERFKKTSKDGVTMPFEEFEREAMLSLFMHPFVRLDSNFFREVADGIDVFKRQSEPVDPDRFALSDAYFWIGNPGMTTEEIAKRINFKGSIATLRKILNDLKVPHKKSPGGRPKTRTLKAV